MNHSPGEITGRRSALAAILTDVHFWIPVVVLVIGFSLLALLS